MFQCLVTENGYGKQTQVDEYRVTSRGGLGIINIDTSERNGKVVAVAHIEPTDEVLMVTQQGMMIRIPTASVRTTGRAAQGVRLINTDEGDRVVAVAKVEPEEVAVTADEAGTAEPVDDSGNPNGDAGPGDAGTPEGSPTE